MTRAPREIPYDAGRKEGTGLLRLAMALANDPVLGVPAVVGSFDRVLDVLHAFYEEGEGPAGPQLSRALAAALEQLESDVRAHAPALARAAGPFLPHFICWWVTAHWFIARSDPEGAQRATRGLFPKRLFLDLDPEALRQELGEPRRRGRPTGASEPMLRVARDELEQGVRKAMRRLFELGYDVTWETVAERLGVSEGWGEELTAKELQTACKRYVLDFVALKREERAARRNKKAP